MLLELGPMAADDVAQWARFTRRMICELKVDSAELTGVVTTDFLSAWQGLVDTWDRLARSGDPVFRWSSDIDAEVAEFLLYGFERCIKSSTIRHLSTEHERDLHRDVTYAVLRAFAEALAAEGRCHEHLIDQIRASVGHRLDV